MLGLFGEEINPSLQQFYLDGDIDGLFEHYRRVGFPHYQRESYSPKGELEQIIGASVSYYSQSERKYKKYSASNGFLFSYFPHWIDVHCGKSPSLHECWDDDALLRTLIEKTVTFCQKHGEGWTENRIRQNAKVYCAKQTVSNFNPVCAKLLYNEFATDGTVYDMSMGWGGRLLGFYASSAQKYIGTDPSVKTFLGLSELNMDLSRACRPRKSVAMFNCGSESFVPEPLIGSVDFCFTSPPYFDTEKYSDEPTQSYIAFPEPGLWLNDFLGQTMANCFALLKENGVMAINIAKFPDSIIPLAESKGFKHLETRQYEISSVSNTSSKCEPIYIFTKGDFLIKKQHTLFDIWQ